MPKADLTFTVGNHWPYATSLFDYIRRGDVSDRSVNPGSGAGQERATTSRVEPTRRRTVATMWEAEMPYLSSSSVALPLRGT